jgi:hypothetical protein
MCQKPRGRLRRSQPMWLVWVLVRVVGVYIIVIRASFCDGNFVVERNPAVERSPVAKRNPVVERNPIDERNPVATCCYRCHNTFIYSTKPAGVCSTDCWTQAAKASCRGCLVPDGFDLFRKFSCPLSAILMKGCGIRQNKVPSGPNV